MNFTRTYVEKIKKHPLISTAGVYATIKIAAAVAGRRYNNPELETILDVGAPLVGGFFLNKYANSSTRNDPIKRNAWKLGIATGLGLLLFNSIDQSQSYSDPVNFFRTSVEQLTGLLNRATSYNHDFGPKTTGALTGLALGLAPMILKKLR
jgi:hypothetical protein